MDAQLRRIQDMLRKEVPEVSPEIADAVQWKVWLALFKGKATDVDDAKLCIAVMTEYHMQLLLVRNARTTYWDPHAQE